MATPFENMLVPPIDTRSETWRVDSMGRAMWVIRRLQQLEQQRTAYQQAATEEIARIKQWADDTQQQLTDDIAQLESLLAPWVKRQLDGSKRKSLKLLSATVGYRTPPKQLAYDEPSLLDWAKGNRRDWIRVKEELDKAAIRQSVIKDSEVVRDANDKILVGVVQPPETFYIKWADTAEEEE